MTPIIAWSGNENWPKKRKKKKTGQSNEKKFFPKLRWFAAFTAWTAAPSTTSCSRTSGAVAGPTSTASRWCWACTVPITGRPNSCLRRPGICTNSIPAVDRHLIIIISNTCRISISSTRRNWRTWKWRGFTRPSLRHPTSPLRRAECRILRDRRYNRACKSLMPWKEREMIPWDSYHQVSVCDHRNYFQFFCFLKKIVSKSENTDLSWEVILQLKFQFINWWLIIEWDDPHLDKESGHYWTFVNVGVFA